MFQDKDVPLNSMLLGLLDRVLLPLATHCSAKALSQFFITNVAKIMTILQTRFMKVSNTFTIVSKHYIAAQSLFLFVSECLGNSVYVFPLPQSNESAFESQIIMKIGCCKLFEVLYSRLPKEEVYSKDSAINQAFCGPDTAEGNELSRTLIK